MRPFVPATVAALCALATLAWAFTPAQDEGQDPMAEMMKQAARWTKPGEHHKVLERFVGKWNTETHMFMGGPSGEPDKGTAEFTWLMPGRWLQYHAQGALMTMQFEAYQFLGYDNFKMSYVSTGVSNFDTAMNRFEGDMTPDGKALVSYGTIDEYLTGEHDKMVKSVWRFLSPDKIVLEVHDLPIGETNTKVFEIVHTRVK